MYGLLLKNLQLYVLQNHGAKKWKEIKDAMKLEQDDFGIDETYPEGQVIKMGKKSMQLLSVKEEEFYEGMGIYFVDFTSSLGYGKTVAHLGRNLRDFLINLDNLHDYLKFTFPKMKPPSFFVESETDTTMVLQYRSKRRGFHFYVQGQVKEVARTLFNLKADIKLKKQEVVFDTVICSFDLVFDNWAYKDWMERVNKRKESSLPVRAAILFEMFPFCLLFQQDLTVTCIGVALRQVIQGIIGRKLTAYFELVKPLIEFKFDIIMSRVNNVFELATQEEVDKLGKKTQVSSSAAKFSEEINLEEDVDKTLHIKGQMIYIPEWQQMLFLACPIMKDLNSLIWCGLFVNDLSMHDYSRDIMLATSQEMIEMRMALSAAETKANALNIQLRKLDEVIKKTDQLLYQMIPKAVAERLRRGENAMDTCEVFPSVTMLFSDIVGFTTICSRIQPPEVVMFLNNLYTLFDFLVDQNQVYKVETIGDAYLIVGGCPVKTNNHALKICDMAFDMMDGIGILKDPGTGQDIQMRIGCHSGAVVAGIVGLKMPRYCLFGLNVALTEKFESNSKPMRIHISEPCKALLTGQYKTEERNEPDLTPKVGGFRSYFLTNKEGRKPLQSTVIKALLPTQTESGNMNNNIKKAETKGKDSSEKPTPSDKKKEAPEEKKSNNQEAKASSDKKAGSATTKTKPEAVPAAKASESPPVKNGSATPKAPSKNLEEEKVTIEDKPIPTSGLQTNGTVAPQPPPSPPPAQDEPEEKPSTLKPTFPNGRRVSQGQTQCFNGFSKSGVCALL